MQDNVAQFGGNAVATGTGASGSGIPRVTVANDSLSAVVSAANSSTTPLAANGVFTGTSESVLGYQSVLVSVFANQASASNGLSIQQSQDGTNWDYTAQYFVSASAPLSVNVPVRAQFMRVVYTNGATLQATFRLQTIKQINGAVAVVGPLNGKAGGNTNVPTDSTFQAVSVGALQDRTALTALVSWNGASVPGLVVTSHQSAPTEGTVLPQPELERAFFR